MSFTLLFATVQSFAWANPTTPHTKPAKQEVNRLLPSVILQTGDPQGFQDAHPNLNLQRLGPKTTQSFRIDTTTTSRAVALADQLSTEGWNASVDMQTIKTPYELSFNDPNYPGQWYLDTLDMVTLWEQSLGDSEIRVAVIDSGIDIAHPDFSDKLISPYDAHADDDDPSPNDGEYCWTGASGVCDEHGTAVSGIAVAANNDSGIVGICPSCSLIPIKMLGDSVGALSADVAAFEHAIANDAAVINNSWGYIEPMSAPQPLINVIARAQTETRNGLGALVVFAAGNDNRMLEDGELCSIEGVLCVSAVDSYGRPTAYTNFGDDVDVSAPSATVSIAPNESLTTNFGGTSAAAPVVSGLAGWILSVRPDLSSQEVADLIIQNSEQSPLITPDENGHHDKYGFGMLSPLKIYETLYPPETEEPQKAGCSTLAIAPSSVINSYILPLLLGCLFWMRRP